MARTWDKVLKEGAQQVRLDAGRRGSDAILRHVPTGFDALDKKYGGARIGVVTELLAHTGDGKSAFMRQLGEGAARWGGGVLWVVPEDPEDATYERQLAGDTGIDTTQIGRLDLSTEELDRIDLAAERARGWAKRVLPVFEHHDVDSLIRLVDETTTIGGAPVRSVLLDYAQLFGTSRNLEDDIARLAEELQPRCRERKFAVVIGSQVANDDLRRGRDAWFNRRDLSQIRPSFGSTEWCRRLERLSKAIWTLVRPNRWLREWGENVQDDNAELHVIKANFGSMGWIELGWDGPTTKFLNK